MLYTYVFHSSFVIRLADRLRQLYGTAWDRLRRQYTRTGAFRVFRLAVIYKMRFPLLSVFLVPWPYPPMSCLQFTFLTLALVPFINAVTIGPVSSLTIANEQISPDGFSRPYVSI